MKQFCECTYCGDIATDRDHIVPVAWNGLRHYEGKVVPACKDCNCVILRDRLIFGEKARKAYVAGALRSRLLKMNPPTWTDAEKEELGPSMQAMVKLQELEYIELVRRVAFAEN